MPTRVAIIDDDDVTRLGTVAVLAMEPTIDVVADLTHAAAAEVEWAEVDVAVVDASDHRRATDQFPGVGVVTAIRAGQGDHRVTIVVVTGVVYDDAIRRRMREAGADYYFHRSTLMSRDALVDAVLRPDARATVPPPVDSEALDQLGITSHSRVNDGVDAALELGFTTSDPELARRGRSRTNRRRAFNREARLETRNADGTTPDRAQNDPSLSQIDRFVRWATRLRDRDA